MKEKKIKIYLAITADEYELPLYVTTNASEMARHYGLNPATVLSAITQNKSGRNTSRKFTSVEVFEDDFE